MACRLEVTCYTKFGETVVVTGSDPSLGCWDLTRAVELKTDEEAFPVWSVSLNMPPPGTEFKFVILLPYGGGAAWEQLACNRRWSAEIFGEGGAVISAKFGEGSLSIGSTPEATVCAACPEEHEQEVTKICKANKIMKACSRWPDKMDASWLAQAWREWEAKVLTAVVGLVNEREASAVRIVCIEGGPWSNMQKAKQPDLLNAVCHELGDSSFPVSVVWMTLSSFRGEYLYRRGNTPVVASRPAWVTAADAAAGGGGQTGSDAVAKGIAEALGSPKQPAPAPWQLGECRGLPGPKAADLLKGWHSMGTPLEAPRFLPGRRRSTGSAQTTAPDLMRLAEELYGPGSDEAIFINRKFGGHAQLPLPKPDEGIDYYDLGSGPEETDDVAPVADCKYFDLSPAPREDFPQSPSKKDNCIDKRRVSSRQRSFWESKQLQQNPQVTTRAHIGSAEDRARSNSVPISRSSRTSGRRKTGTDKERHSSSSFGTDLEYTSFQEEEGPARQRSDDFSLDWERSMSMPQPATWIPKVVVSEAVGGFPSTVRGG